MARPSKYSPQIAERICEQIATSDMGLERICSADDMPSARTVHRWLVASEEFRQNYARARELQADYMAEQILDIADDARNDWMEREGEVVPNMEHVQRSRLRVDSRKWLASKLAPKKYGDKLDLEASGPNGGPIEHVVRVKLVKA